MSDGPYGVFVEVLSFPNAGAHNIALTGEMISMQAELHYLLGRTKGILTRSSWICYADESRQFFELYTEAWLSFLADFADGAPKRPNLRDELNASFLGAIEGTRAVLASLRREAVALDKAGWLGGG